VVGVVVGADVGAVVEIGVVVEVAIEVDFGAVVEVELEVEVEFVAGVGVGVGAIVEVGVVASVDVFGGVKGEVDVVIEAGRAIGVVVLVATAAVGVDVGAEPEVSPELGNCTGDPDEPPRTPTTEPIVTEACGAVAAACSGSTGLAGVGPKAAASASPSPVAGTSSKTHATEPDPARPAPAKSPGIIMNLGPSARCCRAAPARPATAMVSAQSWLPHHNQRTRAQPRRTRSNRPRSLTGAHRSAATENVPHGPAHKPMGQPAAHAPPARHSATARSRRLSATPNPPPSTSAKRPGYGDSTFPERPLQGSGRTL
jgi:hypothetical protein